MKPNKKQSKQFNTVKTFRDNKGKISEEIKGMDFTQFSDYLQENKDKSAGKP